MKRMMSYERYGVRGRDLVCRPRIQDLAVMVSRYSNIVKMRMISRTEQKVKAGVGMVVWVIMGMVVGHHQGGKGKEVVGVGVVYRA
jgi:hypothetical protein